MTLVPIILLILIVAVSAGMVYSLKNKTDGAKGSDPVDTEAPPTPLDEKPSPLTTITEEPPTRERPEPEDTDAPPPPLEENEGVSAVRPPPNDPQGSVGASLRSLFRG